MDESFKGSDGKHYNLSPLTLGDLRRFTQWAQYRDYESFQSLKDRLPPDDFQAESKRLLSDCSRKRLTESSPEVQELFATLEGSVYLIYLSVKRNHPTITAGEIADVVTLPIVRDVADKLLILSGMGNESKKVSGDKLDIGIFYRKGLELGLSPKEMDDITLDQWERLNGAIEEETQGIEITADTSDEELAKAFGLT